jgi:glycerol-3-phosphate acyltransferase PlsY
MVSVFWLILSYLAGAMPFGLLVGTIACGTDPRSHGSRNIGATNVARTCGFKYGVATLILDIAKGGLPVLGAAAMSDSQLFLTLTGLATVLGHMYSVFLHGRGGKGVATCVGVFLAAAPGALFWGIVSFLAALYWTGYVSLGSLVMVTIIPVALLLKGGFGLLPLALILMVFIFWKHRDNIDRLRRGEEGSWRKK